MRDHTPDDYLWTKKRIGLLYDNVKEWTDDVLDSTDKHDVWSMKKLMALDYYMGPFCQIMRSHGFKELFYVDPFSGTGLIPILEKHRFPGSSLIPLFRHQEFPFDTYHLSDINEGYLNALSKRVARAKNGRTINVSITKRSFKDTVDALFTGTRPPDWKSRGYLVFLDPYGFEAVDWNSMKKILSSGAVDIIFTFMTWAIVWNRNNSNSLSSLNQFFGDTEWQRLQSAEDLLSHYCGKIQQFGYSRRYKTHTIDVVKDGGHSYHLILATQSPGGANVLKDLKEKVMAVTTQRLRDAFEATI